MIQINKPIDAINKVLGNQKLKDCKYRNFRYLQICDVESGVLLYNILTREFVFLDDTEASAFRSIDITNKTVVYLIENWFLVPENTDDYLISCQVDKITRMIADSNLFPAITSYTILPTTDCNARCFYCFELGCKRINMTEQTAHDVAKYIKTKSQGEKVTINWFGGEPLYNTLAIDTICKDLTEMGVDFRTRLTTNAYLLDEDMIKKAKELWRATYAQVTLDGTEEIYNTTKAYIYKDDASPFVTVLNNIESALKAGMAINVRLNMYKHNIDDLHKLVNQLGERFYGYPLFRIYVAFLFEDSKHTTFERGSETRKLLYDKIDELISIIDKYNMYSKPRLENMRFVHPCQANRNNSVVIMPDGKLGKCQSHIEENTFGSIYSDKIDMDAYLMYKKAGELQAECKQCKYLPNCRNIITCPDTTKHCDELDVNKHDIDLTKKMRNSYSAFLKSQDSSTTSEDVSEESCS